MPGFKKRIQFILAGYKISKKLNRKYDEIVLGELFSNGNQHPLFLNMILISTFLDFMAPKVSTHPTARLNYRGEEYFTLVFRFDWRLP